MAERVVLKIGGGILRNQSDLENLAGILRRNSHRENILVVSALNGVTNMLLGAYSSGQNITSQIRQKHREGFGFESPMLEPALGKLDELLSGNERSLEREERISCFGEKLSSAFVGDFLNSRGIPAISMDSEACGIESDGRFKNANCRMEATKRNFRRNVLPRIRDGTLVITGYYGIDRKGRINTFGRGGSDYSAASVAAASRAQALEIWKDVEGFMTADPRIVKNAGKLETITFDEAKELGCLGAGILHPRTIDPLWGSKVYVEIKSVLAPEKQGTRIVERMEKDGRVVSSVASKNSMALITVKTGKMADAPGFAARIFRTVAKQGVSVDTITTSQTNISITVGMADLEVVEGALRRMKESMRMEIKRNLNMIGVVGEGMRGADGTSARIFAAVARKGVNIEANSQTGDERSVAFMVRKEHAETCVKAIHEEFGLGNQG